MQRVANARDLLLELADVNLLGRAERFHFRMVFAEAGIQELRFLRDRLLIVRQNFLNRRILDVQGRHHPHQIFALELLDLLQLRLKDQRPWFRRRSLRSSCLMTMVLTGAWRVLRAFRIQIDDVLFVANARDFRGRVVHSLLLLSRPLRSCVATARFMISFSSSTRLSW